MVNIHAENEYKDDHTKDSFCKELDFLFIQFVHTTQKFCCGIAVMKLEGGGIFSNTLWV
jgi:hypothetical protein